MGRHPSNRLDPFSADRQFAPTFQFEAITTARVRRKRMHLLKIDEVGTVDSHEATRQYLLQFVQRLLMQAEGNPRELQLYIVFHPMHHSDIDTPDEFEFSDVSNDHIDELISFITLI